MWRDTKGFWRSRTFWVNIGALVAVIAGMVPPRYQDWVVFAQAGINIGLRFVNEDKVTLTGK